MKTTFCMNESDLSEPELSDNEVVNPEQFEDRLEYEHPLLPLESKALLSNVNTPLKECDLRKGHAGFSRAATSPTSR
jgi:hypothetical protein